MFQSAPRSYPRGDPHAPCSGFPFPCFNPRPGAIPGATSGCCYPRHHRGCFNPRPGAIPGATHGKAGQGQPRQVSIRAPELSPGRPVVIPAIRREPKFQSAPRSYPRGDRWRGWPMPRPRSFNPRPGAIPGATKLQPQAQPLYSVSIRAPELSPGRPGTRRRGRPHQQGFNPRPGAIPGATDGILALFCPTGCFNPRPGAIPGATRKKWCIIAGPCVSIRAPELSPGRPKGPLGDFALSKFQSAPRSYPRGDHYEPQRNRHHSVSIRAPELSPGRPFAHHQRAAGPMFQSAPRSYPRGDPAHAVHAITLCSFNPRPGAIPGATWSLVADSTGCQRFNPRPGAIPGATRASSAIPAGRKCFNPRPGAIPGATTPEGPASHCLNVSIRAPELSPGRLRPNQLGKPQVVCSRIPRTWPERRGKPSANDVKEQRNPLQQGDDRRFRETGGFKPALGVRGREVTGSKAHTS